jgi:SAM-dependent methyltransferase
VDRSFHPTKIFANIDWEQIWAPYDTGTYDAVLRHIKPQDIVLEIGAGDLRLARGIAEIAHKVYAIEIQEQILLWSQAQNLAESYPNLHIICADARTFPFPQDVTAAVLLMRHCTHYSLYVQKLSAARCPILITNARWGMGVEMIHLNKPRSPFGNLEIGWFACWCGYTGFMPASPDLLTPQVIEVVHEVSDCPRCYYTNHYG